MGGMNVIGFTLHQPDWPAEYVNEGEEYMDEDRTRGAATNLGGKAKGAIGGLLSDQQTQAEGKADQVSGQLQNAYGSVKDGALEAAETLEAQVGSFVKERPFVALLSAAGVGWVLSRLMKRR